MLGLPTSTYRHVVCCMRARMVCRLETGIAPTVRVVAKESVDSPLGTERLSKVLGKLVAADTELGSILSPVSVARDRLRSLRDPDVESVGKVGDSVREPRDGVAELDIGMVRPEVRDTTGKVADVLSTFDNELSLEDNDELTDVGNPREIVDPLNERSDTDADTPELGKSKEVDGKLTDKVRKDIVDPLNEMPGKDADDPMLGRSKEVDVKPTDKVGNDEDPPTKLLIETLDTLKAGATVEGTVSASEPEDSERSIDGKDVERLSESYDRTSVDGTVESAVI
ncbi:hypothetical protein Q7P36_000959 [Cladosporium allicinum]